LFAAVTNLFAANEISVSAVTVPQGATVPINIELNNDQPYVAFTFNLNLPDGITVVSITKTNRLKDHSETMPEDPYKSPLGFGALSASNKVIAGNSGALFTVNVTVDETVAVGTKLTGTVSKATFAWVNGDEKGEDELADVSFDITVAEPLGYDVVLEETSTTEPEDAAGVDVKVVRSLVGGNWNTICLPFAMTNAQLKDAFGNDVLLAEFAGSEYDDTNDNLKVKFSVVDALTANTPYIIKVSENISDFIVKNVDIAADKVQKKVSKDKMIGTYVAGTEIDDEDYLFLYDNKFYYSDGTTTMKAFRAYFDLNEVLDNKAAARSRILFDVNENGTTGLNRIIDSSTNGRIYSVSGQYMGEKFEKLPKGVYVIDGKKVIKNK
jgi:hypothetical protein